MLVVDGGSAVCGILRRMLSDEQYQVQVSQSVADACTAVEQKLFEAYVLDYKLPDGSGLDVAERIRSKGSQASIILISGYDPSAVALRAEKLHIFDIIEKPFARATICNAVKKAIGFTLDAEPGEPDLPVAGAAAPHSRSGPASALLQKKAFQKAALVGFIIFLLLISCVAVYLFSHTQ